MSKEVFKNNYQEQGSTCMMSRTILKLLSSEMMKKSKERTLEWLEYLKMPGEEKEEETESEDKLVRVVIEQSLITGSNCICPFKKYCMHV